ncbi:hypothetical protein NSMM_400108 [Nitrosomonas mobilis]|uniref:Uncharacterized protein n=1 Tax=Nitrosomonas mobilis TaxID=51642 RepID=A0A1G5SFK0_9PROT|nr:hypothetical protein NSMM_400108 [Nitrosomonas mobilis]
MGASILFCRSSRLYGLNPFEIRAWVLLHIGSLNGVVSIRLNPFEIRAWVLLTNPTESKLNLMSQSL